jgi:hypothetical protein
MSASPGSAARLPLAIALVGSFILACMATGGPAAADSGNPIRFESYKMEHRPKVVFPGRQIHRSPYPASKFAAAVWADDFCWRTCTGQSGWRFQDCWRVKGAAACRDHLNADNRYCQRTCRSQGGPLLPLD